MLSQQHGICCAQLPSFNGLTSGKRGVHSRARARIRVQAVNQRRALAGVGSAFPTAFHSGRVGAGFDSVLPFHVHGDAATCRQVTQRSPGPPVLPPVLRSSVPPLFGTPSSTTSHTAYPLVHLRLHPHCCTLSSEYSPGTRLRVLPLRASLPPCRRPPFPREQLLAADIPCKRCMRRAAVPGRTRHPGAASA